MSTFCLTKQQRLLNKPEFDVVFADSNRVSSHKLTVFYRTNTSGCARLGLSIAKKRLKRAVDRNTVKRLIREHFRLHQAEVGDVDLVFVANRALTQVDSAEIRQCLEVLWQKLQKVLGR